LGASAEEPMHALAIRIGVLADQLVEQAIRWWNCNDDVTLTLFRRAHQRLAEAAEQIGVLPDQLMHLDSSAAQQLRQQVTAALASMCDAQGSPASRDEVESAAETILEVADRLLIASTPVRRAEQDRARVSAEADTSRVHITARRYTLGPPCGCANPIALAREVTDLQLIHQITCESCGRGWRVAFLADHRQGLRVSWRERWEQS
jgi:hypothetical protein